MLGRDPYLGEVGAWRGIPHAYVAAFGFLLVNGLMPGTASDWLGIAGVASTAMLGCLAVRAWRRSTRLERLGTSSDRPPRVELAPPAPARTMSPAMEAAAFARHVAFSDSHAIIMSRRLAAMTSARRDA